jgi:two-component system NtrC family sensor kinase
LFKSIKNGANRTTEIVKSLKNFTRLDESTIKKADLHEGIDSTLVILGSQMKDRIEVIKNMEI